MVLALAEQFDGLDDDRVVETFELENRLGGGALKDFIGNWPGTGRRIGWLSKQRGSRRADAGDGGGAEEIATGEFHGNGFKL